MYITTPKIHHSGKSFFVFRVYEVKNLLIFLIGIGKLPTYLYNKTLDIKYITIVMQCSQTLGIGTKARQDKSVIKFKYIYKSV